MPFHDLRVQTKMNFQSERRHVRPTMLGFAAVLTLSVTFQVAAQTRPQQPPPPAAAPSAAPAPAPAAPPQVANEPQSTTAAFGDWVMRCARQGEGAAVVRICEVSQTIQVQGQQRPLAQVAFGRVQRTDPMKLTAVLPSNVSFPSVVRVTVEDKDPQPFDLVWRRCIPGACIADAEPNAGTLQRFRARTEPASLTFKDAGGRDVAIPLSMRGLAQALDALAKEAI